jgi:hypothetical protein
MRQLCLFFCFQHQLWWSDLGKRTDNSPSPGGEGAGGEAVAEPHRKKSNKQIQNWYRQEFLNRNSISSNKKKLFRIKSLIEFRNA